VDRHLRGIRARNELGPAEQVEEALAIQLFPPLDDFGMHHGDARRRTAEGSNAQPEKISDDL